MAAPPAACCRPAGNWCRPRRGRVPMPPRPPPPASAWRPAVVPGTVAASLGADVTLEGRHDASDWWYRCTFEAGPGAQALRFEGLATVAEVWLNGERVLDARNMFVPHAVDAGARLRPRNELLVCLRSLDQALAARRPRPRWKTALVPSQNLRWERTTLLGRMPGWNPPVQPVGLWKPVVLEGRGPVGELVLDVQARVEGRAGVVAVRGTFDGPRTVGRARARGGHRGRAVGGGRGPVRRDHRARRAALVAAHPRRTRHAALCGKCAPPPAGWPCTTAGSASARCAWTAPMASCASSSTARRCSAGARAGPPTTSSRCTPTRATLMLARDAGLNMVRVGGTMTYESPTPSYRRADATGRPRLAGLHVRQHGLPARTTPAFRGIGHARSDGATAPACARHPCVPPPTAATAKSSSRPPCSGPPVPALVATPCFAETLPLLCAGRALPTCPTFRRRPAGALPFHVPPASRTTTASVPTCASLEDARRPACDLPSECLGFANMPEPRTTVADVMGGAHAARAPSAAGRRASPRDMGAGWGLRGRPRPLPARAVRALRPRSRCAAATTDRLPPARSRERHRRGDAPRVRRVAQRAQRCAAAGLVWLLKDVWPGGGLGPDRLASAVRKPRVLVPQACVGAALGGVHRRGRGRPAAARGERCGGRAGGHGRVRDVPARPGARGVGRGAGARGAPSGPHAVGRRDAGPFRRHRLRLPVRPAAERRRPRAPARRRRVGDRGGPPFPAGPSTCRWPRPRPSRRAPSACLDGRVAVTLACDTFLQSVHFDCAGFRPDDAHFHVAPGLATPGRVPPSADRSTKFKAHVGALNLRDLHTLRTD